MPLALQITRIRSQQQRIFLSSITNHIILILKTLAIFVINFGLQAHIYVVSIWFGMFPYFAFLTWHFSVNQRAQRD